MAYLAAAQASHPYSMAAGSCRSLFVSAVACAWIAMSDVAVAASLQFIEYCSQYSCSSMITFAFAEAAAIYEVTYDWIMWRGSGVATHLCYLGVHGCVSCCLHLSRSVSSLFAQWM